MKKLLLGIFLSVLVAVISYKGFIWYQVYSQLEQIKEQVAPHAMLKYGWIYSTFDGEVGVSDIEITPYLLKGVITVDAISLKAEDALALLKLHEAVSRRQLPDQLLLRISNLSFPVESDIEAFSESLSDGSEPAVPNSQFNPFGIYACGDVTVISGKELKAMGYNSVTLSSEFQYQFLAVDGMLNISAMAESDSMGRSEMSLDVAVPDNRIEGLFSVSEVPDIKSVRWLYNDNGYYRRLSFYCAKNTGVDRPQYVDEASQEWDADLQDNGILLNRSLVNTYRQYILDGGLISIDVQPESGIDYSVLPLFSANDLTAMLNLKVKVNGAILPDLTVVVEKPEQPSVSTTEPPKPVLLEESSDVSAVPQGRQKQYVEISLDELGDHLRHRVRIELDTGKQVEGTVIRVDELVVEVERSMGGGVVSYPLQKKSIILVKVWK